jgi:hypothetical protein
MTTQLTHYLCTESGMYFVHESHELLFGDILATSRGDTTPPASLREALHMTDGEEYLTDVTDLCDAPDAEIEQLTTWLASIGEDALCAQVKRMREGCVHECA